MRPGCRYSWKPARARPVFWICGLVIGRATPSWPLSSSSGRPMASDRLASRPATVNCGGISSWRLRLWLDQSQVPVRTPEQDVDRGGGGVAEHEERAVAVDDLERGLVDRHRYHLVATRPDDAQRPWLGGARPPAAKCPCGPFRPRRRGRGLRRGHSLTLALAPAALQAAHLPIDLVGGGAERRVHVAASGFAV